MKKVEIIKIPYKPRLFEDLQGFPLLALSKNPI